MHSRAPTNAELDALCSRARHAHEQHDDVRKALAAHDIAVRSAEALMEMPSSVSGRWALREHCSQPCWITPDLALTRGLHTCARHRDLEHLV